MAKKAAKTAPEKIDFESALLQLESIVHGLEEGDLGLSESLVRYENGVKLLRQCYEMLDGAQRRIELLTGVDEEGRPIAQPLDDAELSLEEKADRRSRRRSDAPSGGGESDRRSDVDEPEGMT